MGLRLIFLDDIQICLFQIVYGICDNTRPSTVLESRLGLIPYSPSKRVVHKELSNAGNATAYRWPSKLPILVLNALLVIQTQSSVYLSHDGRDCYMSGKERWRIISVGWVSHLSDKHLLKVSIIARLYALVMVRATSGLYIQTIYTPRTPQKVISLIIIIYLFLTTRPIQV